ncbi:MAG: SDR family oxidoreductase [Steroidobacteraceae bacterium]
MSSSRTQPALQPYLQGKIALVTGVTSGLGWGVAKSFAQRGAEVFGLSRREDRGHALEQEIRAAGQRFTFLTCDIADAAQCEAAVKNVLARSGRIDVLINNAGTGGARPVQRIEHMSEGEWDEVLATNLRAAFTLSRLVLPSMQAQRAGVVLNIASINAVIGVANMAAYNASKAGLVHFTNTLAVENAVHGIRAIAIILGGVRSEMNTFVADEMARSLRGADWQRSPESNARAAAQMGDPEEYGRALALLCSDDARPITGATIALDAGISAGAAASTLIYLGASDLV